MKKINFLIGAILICSNTYSNSSQPYATNQLVPKIINDFTQFCGIDDQNNFTLLSPNYSTISIMFFDKNGTRLHANELYRDYSTKSKLFIYKYKIKSQPKNIILNNEDMGECK